MKRILFLSALLFLLAVQIGFGEIPKTISYQGVLTDTNGKAVPDSMYSLTFKLYDVEAGGTELWSESQSVEVKKGIFNVILGRVNPFNLSFDQPYWLGVTVEGGSELTPRIELTSSPYSLNPSTDDDSPWAVSGDDIYRLEGNVGIGTTEPLTKIHVADSVNIFSGYYRGYDKTIGAGTGKVLEILGNQVVASGEPAGGFGIVSAPSIASPIVWMYEAGDRNAFQVIRKSYNGNLGEDPVLFHVGVNGGVGIGTTEPLTRLHVADSVNILSGYYRGYDRTIGTDTGKVLEILGNQGVVSGEPAGGFGIVSGPNIASPIVWMYQFGDRNAFQVIRKNYDGNLGEDPALFHVDVSGNVGIGTTNPSAKLQVLGSIWGENNTNIGVYGKGVNGIKSEGTHGVYTTATTSGDYAAIWANSYGGRSDTAGVATTGYMVASKYYVWSTADKGGQPLSAIHSPDNEFYTSGTAQLVNGQTTVKFEQLFAIAISSTVPIKVIVTPTGECNGLYVASKSQDGFVVRELAQGTSNVSFDWIVIGRQRGYEKRSSIQRLPEMPAQADRE